MKPNLAKTLTDKIKSGNLSETELQNLGIILGGNKKNWDQAFYLAAANGHLHILNRLIELTTNPVQLLAMIIKNDYEPPFLFAARNGHLEIVKRLVEVVKNLSPSQVLTMIRGDGNYHAFCDAASGNRLAVLKYLIETMRNLHPDQLLAMMSVNDYDAFRSLVLSCKFDAAWHFIEVMEDRHPDQVLAMISSDDYEALAAFGYYGHLPAMKFMLEKIPANQVRDVIRENIGENKKTIRFVAVILGREILPDEVRAKYQNDQAISKLTQLRGFLIESLGAVEEKDAKSKTTEVKGQKRPRLEKGKTKEASKQKETPEQIANAIISILLSGQLPAILEWVELSERLERDKKFKDKQKEEEKEGKEEKKHEAEASKTIKLFTEKKFPTDLTELMASFGASLSSLNISSAQAKVIGEEVYKFLAKPFQDVEKRREEGKDAVLERKGAVPNSTVAKALISSLARSLTGPKPKWM